MPEFITHNLVLKVGALLISMLTWTGIILSTNPPESRTVSLSLPQVTTDLNPKFVRAFPLSDINVTVAGTRDHMNAFDISQLHASVSYSRVVHPGWQQVPVTVSNGDADVKIESAPTTVAADIDTLNARTVPVELIIVNPPPPGYITTASSVNPGNINATGPAHVIAGMKAIVRVDLSADKTNLEADLPVLLTDPAGKAVGNVTVSPTIVRVSVTVSTTSASRSSAVVPRTTGTVATGYQLTGVVVTPSTVTLSGPRDSLNNLDSVATQAINLDGLTSGETVTVSVSPPSGVTASPSVVTVTLVVSRISPTPQPSPTPSP